MKRRLRRLRRLINGFTVVELLVVISVVAILSSVVTISYTTIRQDARDATRRSNATIISEALEKYYDKNGEYPSVASLVNEQPANTGASVASKLSIPPGSLVMPNMPSTLSNPITSNPDTSDDLIAYIAQSTDNNTECQQNTNAGCDQYTLQFLEEGSGEVKAIESRRRSRVTALKPDLEVSVTGTTSIAASWSSVMGATSYELQRSLSNDFSSPVTTTHPSTTTAATASSLLSDTEYFFRVRAVLPDTFSDWSDTQSDTTSSLEAPTGTITITAVMSGTNAQGATSGGTCPAGATIERQIRYQINTNAWVAYTTGTPRDVAATEGYKYTFQAQARCKTGSTYGPWAHSVTASVIRSVTAPSGLTIAAAMSGTNARGTAGGGTCATGTTIERQIRYQINTNAWVAYTTGTPRDVAATEGYMYTFQQQARCVGANASSGWAASGTTSLTRPVTAPASLTISATLISGVTARGTAGGGSCATGTTIERQIRYSGTNTTTDSYVAYTTGTPRDVAANQGWRYTFQQQARCVGLYASSAWAASSTGNTVRPITYAPPAAASVTYSVNGNYTTFTANSVASCPTGTTLMHVYRTITSPVYTYPPSWTIGDPMYNNPPHNWNVPGSTSNSMVWNTTATKTRYTIDFNSYCLTAHNGGPWGTGKGTYYDKP